VSVLLAGPQAVSGYRQQRAPLVWLTEREILGYRRIWRWQQISRLNPLFWLVQAVREGFLGHSDVPAWSALAVLWVSVAALTGWSLYLFARRLQP
jgi:ABC-type polysaccharide/polyol phosphate export permease